MAGRRSAAEELRLLRRQQQALIDAIPDMVWLKDAEGRFLMVNATFARSCGMAPAELVGKSDFDLWPRELAEQYRRNDQLVMASGAATQVEEPLEEPGGHRRWIETIKTPYCNEAGEVVGTVGIARDIDARKRAEAAMASMANSYRDLVESSNSIIIRLDRAGRMIFCNEHAIRFFGFAREELLGRPITATIVPPVESSGRDLGELIAALCSDPDRYALSENENITRDGRRVWVSWANKALQAVGRQEPEILCVGQDITEKKRLQFLMVETEKMVTIGGVAAGMAHELNNPLGAIIQSVQNLRRRLTGGLAANEQVAGEVGIDIAALQQYLDRRGIFEMLTHIATAGTRAADIIAKMLAFSQKGVIGRRSVRLAELMERQIELAACDYDLKKRYDFRGITIKRSYDETAPLVEVNVAEIEQVIFNLLKNAAQSLGDRPQGQPPCIEVITGVQGGFAFFSVADNGPGIPAAVRARIFEPFFTTKQVGEGTGLGLSVSYAIVVQHHQGSIQVDARPGGGARFTVRLPGARGRQLPKRKEP
jgi:PAS domain S-box-containing protein